MEQEDKVYGPIDAIAERICADEDFNIMSAILNTVENVQCEKMDRAAYEAVIEKRIKAKIGCQNGRLAVWEEG